jgi:hypothetical protein
VAALDRGCAAVSVAGISRSRCYAHRKVDTAFAAAWDEAEEVAADRGLRMRRAGVPSRASRNRWSAPENSFEMMTAGLVSKNRRMDNRAPPPIRSLSPRARLCKNRVRNRLSAGGSRIRTVGPP